MHQIQRGILRVTSHPSPSDLPARKKYWWSTNGSHAALNSSKSNQTKHKGGKKKKKKANIVAGATEMYAPAGSHNLQFEPLGLTLLPQQQSCSLWI